MAGRRSGGGGEDPAVAALRAVGLEPGDAVRFRRRAGERWREGVATRLERDGSVGLVDDKGAARAIPVERLEVGRPGRRGTLRWERLADVAARDEQLGLFPAAPPRRPGRRRPPG